LLVSASLFPGSTFQGYASFFVMRAMVAAAREELGLGPPVPKDAEERVETGAIRPILLPASAMRPVAALPPGRTVRDEGGQQEKVLQASVLMDDEDDEDEEEEEEEDEEEEDMRKLLTQRKGAERMRLRRQKAMRRVSGHTSLNILNRIITVGNGLSG
jgi:hypothetical protein